MYSYLDEIEKAETKLKEAIHVSILYPALHAKNLFNAIDELITLKVDQKIDQLILNIDDMSADLLCRIQDLENPRN